MRIVRQTTSPLLYILTDIPDNCLLQQTQIAKLDRANKHDLEWLLDWYRHDHGGARFLTGYEARALDPSEVSDLVTISSRSSKDKFTRWIEEHLLQRLPGFIMNKWRVGEHSQCNRIQQRLTTTFRSPYADPNISKICRAAISSFSGELFELFTWCSQPVYPQSLFLYSILSTACRTD
jgi:hypothetical protein